MQSVASLGKIIVISPHLDDAVFACAGLIAGKPGTVVVTIFAGMPSDFAAYTSWDAASGFDSARQAVACRRDEDRNALEILDAMPLWLDFLDSQYGCTPTVDSVADILKEILRQHDPDTVPALEAMLGQQPGEVGRRAVQRGVGELDVVELDGDVFGVALR